MKKNFERDPEDLANDSALSNNSIDNKNSSGKTAASGNNLDDGHIMKHVSQVLFEQKLKGVYARDQTDRPKSIKISLPAVLKKVQRLQGRSGSNIYGNLMKEEIKHSNGLQQTTTGTLIENFYLLRVKCVI